MLKIDGLFSLLDERAPLSLSYKLIERGDYDNSGIIIRNREEVKKILFTLDLSLDAIKKAKKAGCDTIITHHPAIYSPIKNLDCTGDTAAVLLAAKSGLNVISMHLNLDVAKGGIDECLMRALGGEKFKIIDELDEKTGYGKEFDVNGVTLAEFKNRAIKETGAKRIVVYGNAKTAIKKAASFCGAGASHCVKYVKDGGSADVIVTSDMPHHVIKYAVESGKSLLLLTHYAAENYGMKKYYEKMTKALVGKAETVFFADKRFM